MDKNLHVYQYPAEKDAEFDDDFEYVEKLQKNSCENSYQR
jgi:hypothetical protein